MQFPFKVIESKYASRSEFRLTDGHQPTHALFYLKKGIFTIQINDRKETIATGDCYILPDYVHHLRNVIEPIEFVYVQFADNPVCPYKMEIPCGKVNFTDKQRFISNITSFEKLLLKDDSFSAGFREHLLLDILFQIHSESHPESTFQETTVSHDSLVNKAIEYIEHNLSNKILIEDICKHAGTNPSTLNFKFRREFNSSVRQYIICERIKKARKLLISTSYSISEIAVRCGFLDVYYFSNAFKKVQGICPSMYRK
ncbi:MAG: helix-turn-helix transcriptional regulator [Clostridia bacterium]|nr:helix-turn-helix transcriptional regulator [Clostridia bacterium]